MFIENVVNDELTNRELTAPSRQGTQQHVPESPTVTPPGVQVNTRSGPRDHVTPTKLGVSQITDRLGDLTVTQVEVCTIRGFATYTHITLVTCTNIW